MNNPEIEPCLKISGSAFVGNTINGTRPASYIKNQDYLNVVKLTDWCAGNFISIKIGYKLIKRKYLLAFRRHHIWWVASNPECLEELLEYLNLDGLYFDADNSGG
jgi:hypothetical protein